MNYTCRVTAKSKAGVTVEIKANISAATFPEAIKLALSLTAQYQGDAETETMLISKEVPF